MEEEEKRAENSVLRLVIPSATVFIPLLIWGADGILGNTQKISELSAKQNAHDDALGILYKKMERVDGLAQDPAPKPETRVALQSLLRQIEALTDHVNRLENRIDGLDSRINRLHEYLMSPSNRPPFVKRGELTTDLPTAPPRNQEN